MGPKKSPKKSGEKNQARPSSLTGGEQNDNGEVSLYLEIFNEIRKLQEGDQAPVVQRPDNFIQWISHYLTVSICAKISVFPLVEPNMCTLTTA